MEGGQKLSGEKDACDDKKKGGTRRGGRTLLVQNGRPMAMAVKDSRSAKRVIRCGGGEKKEES